MNGAGLRIPCLMLVLLPWILGSSCKSGSMSPPPRPFLPPVQGHASLPPVNTFSVVGYDPRTGELGVAVQSKFFNVGSVVPWAEANVGAVATQSYANTAYGTNGLALMKRGKSARETLRILTEADSRRAFRQVGLVDGQGQAASFTGEKCNAWAGHHVGKHFCVQGNLLAGEAVVQDMVKAYENSRDTPGTGLADWLMASLIAGQAAGGDKRGKQSAALLVVREKGGFGGATDRFIDLHVEDHPNPIQELNRLLQIHKQFFKSSHRSGKRE